MDNQSVSRRIHVLRDSIAKRIAAGEVIDRPFSVVRELLDNSIDSGANDISLHILGGGIKSIRCVDNGHGMNRDDLELCFLPHSTSKIADISDLDSLSTLGFRGEALSSISACARLEISSKQADSPHAYSLYINNGKKMSLAETSTADGTVVEVSDLFYSIPARLKFLKRESAETLACQNMYFEKACPFPEISFRLFADNKLKSFLPKSTLKERVIAVNGSAYPLQFTYEAKQDYGSFGIALVMTGPSVYRKDRRLIHIYVNKRRISEYALVQAAEYGYTGYLPGGCFPVISVFIDIRADLVDFNIHPAKKEIKLLNLREVHRALVSLIQQELKGRARQVQNPGRSIAASATESAIAELFPSDRLKPGPSVLPAFPSHTGATTMDSQSADPAGLSSAAAGSKPGTAEREAFSSFVAERSLVAPEKAFPDVSAEFVYFGQIFTTFLLCLKEDKFYFIDQHAAHEKLLYQELTGSDREIQDLLVPALFSVEREIDEALQNGREKLKSAGISLSRIRAGEWQITGLSPLLSSQQEEIVEFLETESSDNEKFSQKFFANLACKSAIRDGDRIDEIQAVELIRQTFRLENPRCPHGRPVWFSLTKEELFRFVGRII